MATKTMLIPLELAIYVEATGPNGDLDVSLDEEDQEILRNGIAWQLAESHLTIPRVGQPYIIRIVGQNDPRWQEEG